MNQETSIYVHTRTNCTVKPISVESKDKSKEHHAGCRRCCSSSIHPITHSIFDWSLCQSLHCFRTHYKSQKTNVLAQASTQDRRINPIHIQSLRKLIGISLTNRHQIQMCCLDLDYQLCQRYFWLGPTNVRWVNPQKYFYGELIALTRNLGHLNYAIGMCASETWILTWING